jgi:organic radical activating enzyme
MKQPGIAAKGFKTRVERNKFKITGLEREVLTICEGLPIEYVGDGKLILGNLCPDFSIPGRRKLIEVWASDAPWARHRGSQYITQRQTAFSKMGYESLFLPLSVDDLCYSTGRRPQIRERIAQFINNGRVVQSITPVTEKAMVRLYGSRIASRVVYNLEVEDTHTYLANGIVVHNCDTAYAQEEKDGVEMSLSQILHEVQKSPCKWICITGGEPYTQNLQRLANLLKTWQYNIQVETNGTLYHYAPIDHITISPKLAGGNIVKEQFRKMFYAQTSQLRSPYSGDLALPQPTVEFKYVAACEADIPVDPITPASLQPKSNTPEATQFCIDTVKGAPQQWRLSIQLHKLLQVR